MSHSTRITPKTVLLGAAAALTLLAAPSFAAPTTAPLDIVVTSDSVTIEFAPDALSSQDSIVAVYDILKDEAEDACTDNRRVDRRCADGLMNDFIESADNDGLSALHGVR